MGTTFTREQLNTMTSKEMKRMCVEDLKIAGVTKKPKEVVIEAIMSKYGAKSSTSTPASTPVLTPAVQQALSGVEFSGRSVITKPGAPFGQRATTTIHVSCGASSGNFPVMGRSVKQIGEFLREVLNVDRLSTGLVNGKEVDAEYILKQGDNLEYLKPAGKKGC